MKTYPEILKNYRAAVWDGASPVRCATGLLDAEAFRRALRLPPEEEVYLISTDRRRVPNFVGVRYDTPEGETAADCARYRIARFAEAAYNAQPEVEDFVPFPAGLLPSIQVGDTL